MTEYYERWDEAEADVDRGSPWKFREPGAPNPLTVMAEEWIEITTDFGDTDLLLGRDRNGKRWSVLAGSTILRKGLVDGIMEEWDDGKKEFVVRETLGKVEPGEIVSIKYEGEREGGKFTYANFSISRKPAREGVELPKLQVQDPDVPEQAAPDQAAPQPVTEAAEVSPDDIPF